MLKEWLDKYYDVFDERYPLCVTSTLSDEEIINDIKLCIASKKPKKDQHYKANSDY